MRMLKDEGGNVLVLTVLSFTLLISFLAFAIDVGNVYYAQRQVQTLADTAAIAGALETSACGAPRCGVMQTAVTTALTEGGNPTPTLFQQCAAASGTGLLLTLNNGPCALGTSDPNNGDTNYVEVVVTKQVTTFFAGIIGYPTFQISARAEAGHAVAPAGNSGPCMNLTGGGNQTLLLNSGATIKDATGSTCGLMVDSSASGTCAGGTPAVMANSGATVNVSSFNIVGKYCNNGASLNPVPTTGASAVADPFAAEIAAGTLSTPPKGDTQYQLPPNQSQYLSTVSGTTTLKPGYYPQGLNFNGSGYTVTLNPGVYYMDGNVMMGGVTINGSGVTIYMASGQLNMNSAATVNLTAPTSGPTAGLAIWQAASDNYQMNLDSAVNSSWGGAIYLPGAQLTLNSGSNVITYGMLVAQSLTVDSNSGILLSCASMPGGICPGGSGGGTANGATNVSLAE